MTSRNERHAFAWMRAAKILASGTRPAQMAVARAISSGPAPKTVPKAAVISSLAGARHAAKEPSRARRTLGGASGRTDQKRLAELKVKIGDEEYMNGAILRIATVLSARLTLR